jgi:hypothetical protein
LASSDLRKLALYIEEIIENPVTLSVRYFTLKEIEEESGTYLVWC